MSKIHFLKTWPEFFDAVSNPDPRQRKTVEIRKNDRGFEVGDFLALQEYDTDTGYTGNVCVVLVTHILDRQPWVPEGYVAMSIAIYIGLIDGTTPGSVSSNMV